SPRLRLAMQPWAGTYDAMSSIIARYERRESRYGSQIVEYRHQASVTPAAQFSSARRLLRRAGRTSATQSSVRKLAATTEPRWNVGWKPTSVSRKIVAIAGDMPLRRASTQTPQTRIASRPNVRMPNQSSAAEKPRASESTSSDASSAHGTSSGSA